MKDDSEKTFTITCTMKHRWVPHFLGHVKIYATFRRCRKFKSGSFYADGDGDFRPKFEWDKELPSDGKPINDVQGDRIYDAG